ncbi:SMP-30/gluconolactonase/LRE family protein [Marinobacter sp. V034]|uniref:SMP-30/gluconolactonase/LRE family protein n=1 Tax=Marinobacter sp. V034 TaxID=3459610 RepID=UPI004045077C
MNFKPVMADRFILGEAPHWDADEQEMLWVDIAGRAAYAYHTESTRLRQWHFDEPVSAIVPRAGNHYLVATGRGAYGLNADTGAISPIAEPAGEPPGNRTNEARVDPQGRFWMASMENNIGPDGGDIPVAESTGMLWCIDTDHSIRRVESGIGISNSLVWSPDQTRMYFADTLQRVIWVYDWDATSGEASNRRVFAATEGCGNPDGSAMDEEGCLWNARWGAGCIIRYRPDGSIDRIVDVPARCPSSCVFGGPDRKTLYVTTAFFGMPESERGEYDGALLAAATDIRGQECTPYGG